MADGTCDRWALRKARAISRCFFFNFFKFFLHSRQFPVIRLQGIVASLQNRGSPFVPNGTSHALASVRLVDAYGGTVCGLPALGATVSAALPANVTATPALVYGTNYSFTAASDYLVVCVFVCGLFVELPRKKRGGGVFNSAYPFALHPCDYPPPPVFIGAGPP